MRTHLVDFRLLGGELQAVNEECVEPEMTQLFFTLRA